MLLAVQRHLTVVQDENGDRWVQCGLLHSGHCLGMRKRNRPDAHWPDRDGSGGSPPRALQYGVSLFKMVQMCGWRVKF